MRPLIARVRFPDGVEGDVLHVSLGEYTIETAHGVNQSIIGYLALVRLDNGKLTTKKLEGAQDVRREPVMLPIGVRS